MHLCMYAYLCGCHTIMSNNRETISAHMKEVHGWTQQECDDTLMGDRLAGGDGVRDWEHEVLMFIDRTGRDFSYDYFLWLVTNAAWCPKCDKVNDGEGGPHMGNDVICDECVEVTA